MQRDQSWCAGKPGSTFSYKIHKLIKFIKLSRPKTSMRVKNIKTVAKIRKGAKGISVFKPIFFGSPVKNLL